jgi:hypothetical protein
LAEVPKAHLALLVLLEQQVLEQLVLLVQLEAQALRVLLEQQVHPAQLEVLVLLAVLALLVQQAHMAHRQRRSVLREDEVILVLSERRVLLAQAEAVEQAGVRVLLEALALQEVLEQLVRLV